jgi:TolA-binding protein
MMNASRLLVFGLVVGPVILMAQRREDILSIQRDVAQLQDQVKQLQRSQDDQIAALKTLVQQAVEASGKLGTGLATLQQSVSNVTKEVAEQQGKVIAPVVNLETKVDQISEDFRSVRENLAGLSSRLGTLDGKLTDISSAVRTLAAPPPPPPAPPATASTTPGPPPGVSAESLYQNAFRDYSSAKDDLAMDEFNQYLKYFSQTENGPAAEYYIGSIFDRAKQYPDAVEAFNAVLERFPENPKTPDALYMKGVDLMKDGRRTEAAAEFKDFLKRYPNHDLAAKAQGHLRTLGLAAPARPPAARKKN